MTVVFLYYASTVLSWIYFPDGYFLVLFVIVNSLLAFLCAIITHNSVHCPVFRNRGLNRLFQIVLSLSYGHPVSSYVSGHNYSHHKHTHTRKDYARTTKIAFKWNLLNQLFFFYRIAGDILTSELRFAKLMRKEKPRWYRQYLLEAALVLGTKIILLLLDWQRCLLLVFIPHHYAVWGINGTNYWQHDGCDPHHKFNHTRSFTSRLLNYIAFNNGYHGIHHRNPGLHWSVLPKFHVKYIQPNVHPNLDLKSLTAFLWKSCVWPGKRLRFDGKPVIIPKSKKDEDWIELVKLPAQRSSLGAEI